MRVLSQSDLTLSPVGINTECYRIYESLALGSVPVIEDIMTPGLCGDTPASLNQQSINNSNHILLNTAHNKEYILGKGNYSAPLRLLKALNAPVIFIKDWKANLNAVLQKESEMTDMDIIKRREHVIQWYEKFKTQMSEQLVNVLLDKFFHRDTR